MSLRTFINKGMKSSNLNVLATNDDYKMAIEMKNEFYILQDLENVSDQLDLVNEQLKSDIRNKTFHNLNYRERQVAEILGLAGFKLSEFCVESGYDSMSQEEKTYALMYQIEESNKQLDMTRESLITDITDKFVHLGRALIGKNKDYQEAAGSLLKKIDNINNFNKEKIEKIINKRISNYNSSIKGSFAISAIDGTGDFKDVALRIVKTLESFHKQNDAFANAIRTAQEKSNSLGLWGRKGGVIIFWLSFLTSSWIILIPMYFISYKDSLRKIRNIKIDELKTEADLDKVEEYLKELENESRKINPNTNVKITNIKAPIKTLTTINENTIESESLTGLKILTDLAEGLGRKEARTLSKILNLAGSISTAHNELLYQTIEMLKDIEREL